MAVEAPVLFFGTFCPADAGVNGIRYNGKMSHSHPWGITLVAVLMILFGLAEVVTGFTHNFLRLISTASVTLATYGAATVGALYAIGGLLLLTMKKWAARLAMVCLVLVVVGRISLVLTGLYPLTSLLQDLSIIIGTTIAIIYAVYIALKWKSFN